jgi:condensin complex subunit 2
MRKQSGDRSALLLPELRVLLVWGMALRTPLKARVQSPRPHLLTPNDDDAERAQMRVARATTLLRKSGMMMAFDFEQVSTPQRESNVFSRDRILELHHNCIKLAAENVRQHYVSLPLLDHC